MTTTQPDTAAAAAPATTTRALDALAEAGDLLRPMVHALNNWAARYENMHDLADSFHGSLNLGEAIALADLLDVAGRGDLAAYLLRGWMDNDPEAVAEYEAEESGYLADLAASYEPTAAE